MAIIVAGHPRSGTSFLQLLCRSHPEVSLTSEFGSFAFIGATYGSYCRSIYERWKEARDNWAFDPAYGPQSKSLGLINLKFTVQHALRLRKHLRGETDVAAIEATYKEMFPKSRVVGDKWPDYLFLLDELALEPDLKRIVIYRDCRDVASSFLERVRTVWQNADWIKYFDTPEKIAKRWVKGIELIEKHADSLLVIQYEQLALEPQPQLERLGGWLGINPTGFNKAMARPGSIGKYKHGLKSSELDAVMQIAGPTMSSLGYC